MTTESTSSTISSTLLTVASTIINGTSINGTSSASQPGNCLTLNPICDNSGICQYNGVCRCFVGWSPKGIYKGPYDCQGRLTDQPGPRFNLTFGLVFSGVVAGICFALACYRLFIEIRGNRRKANDAPITNITKISVILIIIQSALLTVLSVDYHGIYGRIGVIPYWLGWLLRDSLLMIIFSCILFHWVELYQYTLTTLRKQEMMAKINSNYNPNFTVEDLLDRVTFLKRFRLPFMFFGVLSFVAYITYVAGYFTARTDSAWNGLSGFYSGYYAFMWFVFAVAFGWAGFRLMRLMTSTISAEAKKMTIKLCIISVVATLDKIVSVCYFLVIIPTKNPNIISVRILCNLIVQVLILVVVLEIYMPVDRFREWFTSAHFSSTGRSGSAKSRDITTNEVEMYPEVDSPEQNVDIKAGEATSV